MPSDSWLNGWLPGDTVGAAEFKKSVGSFYDSTAVGLVASFDITSVPTWGAGIEIQCQLRGDTAANIVAVQMRFNNDSTAIYYTETLDATAAAPTSGESLAATLGNVGQVPAANATANRAGTVNIFIPNFTGTTWHKTWTTQSNYPYSTGTGTVGLRQSAGVWANTAAVTRITILPNAGNFAVGSRVTAYVRGA